MPTVQRELSKFLVPYVLAAGPALFLMDSAPPFAKLLVGAAGCTLGFVLVKAEIAPALLPAVIWVLRQVVTAAAVLIAALFALSMAAMGISLLPIGIFSPDELMRIYAVVGPFVGVIVTLSCIEWLVGRPPVLRWRKRHRESVQATKRLATACGTGFAVGVVILVPVLLVAVLIIGLQYTAIFTFGAIVRRVRPRMRVLSDRVVANCSVATNSDALDVRRVSGRVEAGSDAAL